MQVRCGFSQGHNQGKARNASGAKPYPQYQVDNQKGVWEFDKMRPGWELPIHQLMAKNNVTIFFQGHDHLFAKQELDGIIYQEVPCPADNTYTAFNKDAYKSGDIFPNAGFLDVTVSPDQVKVDYIKSGQTNNGQSIFLYIVK